MVDSTHPLARRSLLSHLGVGAALGAGLGVVARANAQPAAARFQPTRHAQDDWLDRPKGGHRFVIDSTTPDGAGAAFLYANNFFTANKNGYNLDSPALAVIVVLRHFSTPFAYTDAMWAKYGAQFSALTKFTDPKTKQAPSTNLYNSAAYGMTLPNLGSTLGALIKENVQFAVCDMATHFFSGQIAGMTKGNADAIYKDLAGNLIANSHLVSAGIVAVNRAQERGYTFAYAA